MEGVASEAALAGHLRLGKLVDVYDDNKITIDGPTDMAFSTEHVGLRFEAYGWQVIEVDDGNDLEAIEQAMGTGWRRKTARGLRTAASCSPRAGTRNAHSDPHARRAGAGDEGGALVGSRNQLPDPHGIYRAWARS